MAIYVSIQYPALDSSWAKMNRPQRECSHGLRVQRNVVHGRRGRTWAKRRGGTAACCYCEPKGQDQIRKLLRLQLNMLPLHWCIHPGVQTAPSKGYHTCHPQTQAPLAGWSAPGRCQSPSWVWASLSGSSSPCVSGTQHTWPIRKGEMGGSTTVNNIHLKLFLNW